MSKPTPVAWIVNKALDELKKHHSASATVWSGLAKNKFINDAEPLYSSSALQALEEENARLREGIKRLSEEEEICGETMSEEDAFDLVRMAAKLAEYEKANVAYVDANTALIARATAAEAESNRLRALALDYQAGYLEAAARLEEALKVIEPFAKFTPEQCFKKDTCWELVECKATGGGWFGSEDFRAARRFFTALQEKENTNGK